MRNTGADKDTDRPGRKIALVASSGGHCLELYTLKSVWENYDRFWVTFPGDDTLSLLTNERVYFAHSPTNRSLIRFIKNLFLAPRILLKEKPRALLTTGAGVGVPFVYIAKILGIKTLYLELITRVNDLSLSGKLVYFLADEILVQWPELAEKYRRARYVGQVI